MTTENQTLRRSVEQVKHCVQEALSVIERNEDLDLAQDDLRHARDLLVQQILPALAKKQRVE